MTCGLPLVPLDLKQDPMTLNSKQLFDLACAMAQIGTLICDVARPASEPGAVDPHLEEPPYIWDIKED